MKLHTSEAEVLVDIWAALKNYIPVKDQRQAAEQFVATVDDIGLVDLSECSKDLYGTCETFDQVLRNYCQENGFDEEIDDWDD